MVISFWTKDSLIAALSVARVSVLKNWLTREKHCLFIYRECWVPLPSILEWRIAPLPSPPLLISMEYIQIYNYKDLLKCNSFHAIWILRRFSNFSVYSPKNLVFSVVFVLRLRSALCPALYYIFYVTVQQVSFGKDLYWASVTGVLWRSFRFKRFLTSLFPATQYTKKV